MRLIFFQTYIVIPQCIELAQQSPDDFRIITSNRQGYNFFRQIFEPEKLIFINPPKPLFTKPKIFAPARFLYNLKLKFQLKKQFKEYSNTEVYFFLVAFAPEIAYIVKQLSKKNTIYHSPSVKLPASPNAENSPRHTFNRLYLRILWGLQTHLYPSGKIDIYRYSETYFKRIKSRNFEPSINHKRLKNIMQKRLSFETKPILFLSGGLPDLGFVTKEEYISKTNLLLKLAGTHNIMLKTHPRFPNKYGDEKKIQEIPAFIPANLLFYFFDIVIGWHTSTIYEAANADVKAISLLNFYTPAEKGMNKKYIKYLNENLLPGKKIYFPETSEDFLELIAEHKL